MKKIKDIIILYPSFERGGVTVNLINFINFALKKKNNIYLISRNPDLSKFDYKKRIKFIKIGNCSIPFISERLLTSLLSIVSLIRIFDKCKKSESVVFSFQSNIIPIIISKIFNRKIIVRNSEDAIDATKFADNKFFAYFILLSKIIFYNFADGIITNSQKSKKSLQSIIYVKKKIRLIFNPYLQKILKRKKKNKENLILSVGRLCKQKNFETLIKGFYIFQKKFPKYKLLILGHGYNEKKLLNLAISLRIDKKIKFKGWVKDVRKYYDTPKIFVMTSLYEGLPNALIDAVNFEIPSISTKCSGASDILTNKNGIFFRTMDDNDLADKMIKCVLNYQNSMKKIKRSKKFIKHFLAEPQSKKYLEYCNEIIQKI